MQQFSLGRMIYSRALKPLLDSLAESGDDNVFGALAIHDPILARRHLLMEAK